MLLDLRCRASKLLGLVTICADYFIIFGSGTLPPPKGSIKVKKEDIERLKKASFCSILIHFGDSNSHGQYVKKPVVL